MAERSAVPQTKAVLFRGLSGKHSIYAVGTTKTTTALDEALAGMKKGERRIVIAQGALAYGTAGFYAKEKPGEKRFVISPNTTLVYEVERIS